MAFLAVSHRWTVCSPTSSRCASVACDMSPTAPVQAPRMSQLQHRPIHDFYDTDVTQRVPVMTIDEIAAEKLARWQRRPTVRDLYDLTHMRPLIGNTAEVCEMYVIKSHWDFHNPNRGPATFARTPVELEGLIDGPDLADLKLDELQFDVPMTRSDKRDLVVDMLASLPDRYGFCIDAMGTRLQRWGQDTEGTCAQQVARAAKALSRVSHPQQPQHDSP